MRFLSTIVLAIICTASLCCKEKSATPSGSGTIDNQPVDKNDLASQATANYAKIDVSPMDMSYFPVEYPKIKMANGGQSGPLVRVIYSRPHLGKRHISDIVKPGKPWRMGANEATEIQFYKPAMVKGKRVNPGRYILYCIPAADHWTIALNSNIDSWGLQQDSTRDVHRFDIPVSAGNPPLEYFTIEFEKTKEGADMVIGWDDILARLPVTF